MRRVWSDEENEVVVREYFGMLEQDLTGQPYVKRRAAERAEGLLNNRNHKSVEFKFSNVSAVLEDSHALFVEGYKPLPHYQQSLVEAVERYLDARPGMLDLMSEQVTQRAVPRVDFVWLEVPPPGVSRLRESDVIPLVLHTDFARLEAANRALGRAGEEMVAERERQALCEGSRPDLAALVEHASLTRGDGLGYDIASFALDGRPRHLEVKTTRRGKTWPMVVTRREVDVSRMLSETYVLARVFGFTERSVGIYEVSGGIEDTCHLDPLTYRAMPKVA